MTSPELDRIYNGDCLKVLDRFDEPFADLIFADPPFNIGYQYDVYEDRMAYEAYHGWTEQWMQACRRVLKPTGAFWIAIGDEYAAEVRMIGRELGLTLRNWVIWHYSFGQQTQAKFARSHAHLFYFVADPKNFTFNDMALRTFSDRQRIYRDKRASELGRLPDDTWNEFPRLCGTFGEREGWHPCQMPETVLSRIVVACSGVGEVVLDPFAGSGTTPATAKKLSRRYVGVELSKSYAGRINIRLAAVRPLAAEAAADELWPPLHTDQLVQVFMPAAVSTDMLHANPALLRGLTTQFNRRLELCGSPRRYEPEQIWRQLERMRIDLKLPMVKIHSREPRGPERAAPDVPPPLAPRQRRKPGRRPAAKTGGADAAQD